MAVDKNKLAETMGEGEHVRPSMTLVPMITLEGNKGVFMRRNVGDDGYEKPVELGQTFSGVIVGIRQVLSSYEPKSIKTTPEYSYSTDKVALFERKGKDAKSERIDEDFIMSLKAHHPELREQRWVYLLVNDEVVKFKVKGAGLKHWFKFLGDITRRKLHTFEVRVKFDAGSEKNGDLGKDYFVPVFTIEKELTDEEIEAIEPHINQLSTEFRAIAEYRAKKHSDQASGPADAPSLDEVPVINLDDEEEIKPEEVPF